MPGYSQHEGFCISYPQSRSSIWLPLISPQWGLASLQRGVAMVHGIAILCLCVVVHNDNFDLFFMYCLSKGNTIIVCNDKSPQIFLQSTTLCNQTNVHYAKHGIFICIFIHVKFKSTAATISHNLCP
jgi:hypothetical protein